MKAGGPSYPVKHLFRLLTFFGVSQAEVCARLGISQPLVSLWATGKRKLPQRHKQALFDLTTEAFVRASAEDMIQNPDGDPEGRDQLFGEQVSQLLDDWAIEVGEQRYIEKISDHCRTIARYATDPEKLGAALHGAEGPQIREAAEEILRTLKLLDRIYSPSPVEEIRRRMAMEVRGRGTQ